METIGPFIIAIAFIGMLFGVFWLLGVIFSRMTGWKQMAEKYANSYDVSGQKFGFVSGKMGKSSIGSVNFGNSLFFVINDQGFSFSVIYPINLFMPTLFIPWQAIQQLNEKKFLFFDCLDLSFKEYPTKLRIWGKAGKAMKAKFDAS